MYISNPRDFFFVSRLLLQTEHGCAMNNTSTMRCMILRFTKTHYDSHRHKHLCLYTKNRFSKINDVLPMNHHIRKLTRDKNDEFNGKIVA